VLDAWFPGVENGNAIANILYGNANPSGHLPQTFPKSLADMPTKTPQQYPGVNSKVSYSEGMKIGYRWFDSENIEPLFPFGYGLSYTSFKYSGLKLTSNGKTAKASFTVTNTGKRSGADVAQAYVAFPKPLGEPPRQLKGFQKVYLDAGDSKRVTIPFDTRAFSYWDSRKQDWVEARGCYGIAVGDSSRSLPLSKTIAIRGAHCGAKKKHRRPEYDSDDDLPSGSRRVDNYDMEDGFLVDSEEESEAAEDDEDEEELLDDDEEEDEAPRPKRQRTAEPDQAAGGDDDGAAHAESSRNRRRRVIQDDDEDEE